MVGRGVCYDGGVVLWWAGVYVMMGVWCYGGQGCMLRRCGVMVGRGVCYDGGVMLWWAGVYVKEVWCYGGQGCML